MKLLVVSQYYAPEPFRVTDLCEELVRRGHDVTVLCGIPNYPSGRFLSGTFGPEEPDGKPGTASASSEVGSFPADAAWKIGLVLNYFSYLGSAWMRHFRLARQGFDAVFCYEVSPLTMALPAVAVARRAHIPMTLYLTDLWPENVQAVSGLQNRTILSGIGKMASYVYRHCDRILISSQRFRAPVMERGGNPTRIFYWPQYAEDHFSKREEAAQIVPGAVLQPEALEGVPFPVVFTGNLGFAQGSGHRHPGCGAAGIRTWASSSSWWGTDAHAPHWKSR